MAGPSAVPVGVSVQGARLGTSRHLFAYLTLLLGIGRVVLSNDPSDERPAMATTVRLPLDVFDWRRQCPEYTPTTPTSELTLSEVRAAVYEGANRIASGRAVQR